MSEASPAAVAGLTRYLPGWVLRRLRDDPTPTREAAVVRSAGGLVFADVSGFSNLAEKLARRGAVGAEEIGHYLDDYFGQLIDIVSAHGGDIVKFAGDALVAEWDDRDTSLSEAVARASACSLAVQKQLGSYTVGEDLPLALRITIGAGTVHCLVVGGVLSRWETIFGGEPFAQIRAIAGRTRPGEVVLSAEAWGLLGTGREGEPLEGTSGWRLRELREAPAAKAALRAVPEAAADAAVRTWLPGVIVSRLAAGHRGWLGELRHVSVLFAALPPLPAEVDERVLDANQRLVADLQRCVYRHDGSINKISVDEKGAMLVAAFGLPPLSHEDDPRRAVGAALLMRDVLGEHVAEAHIGIASGQVFCGTIGNATRAEYTVVGNVVNLAARLMGRATTGILCDEATWRVARDHLEFDELEPLELKGRFQKVNVYAPTGRAIETVRPTAALVGRERERASISEALQALVREKEGSALVIVGEAGIGKTRLIEEVLSQARSLGVRVLHGRGGSHETTAPYFVWRAIVAELLGLPAAGALQGHQAAVREGWPPCRSSWGPSPCSMACCPWTSTRPRSPGRWWARPAPPPPAASSRPCSSRGHWPAPPW
jgi:class 3 adenylate cyclase